MVYRGRIQNGHVVLDAPHELPEGALVEVEVIESTAPHPPSPLLRYAGQAKDLPEDASETIDSLLYQRDHS